MQILRCACAAIATLAGNVLHSALTIIPACLSPAGGFDQALIASGFNVSPLAAQNIRLNVLISRCLWRGSSLAKLWQVMMRLAWFIVLFFCLGPFMPAPVSARVDEDALVQRVRAAEKRVNTAERELRQTQAKYQPAIDSYQAAEAEVARLRAAWQAARETLWDDANKEKALPKSLEARKEALLEHYSRMQLLHLKDKSSANKTKLLLSKRKYEEVQRQIRDFNAGNAQAKRRFAAAEARYDRLWGQYEKARDRLPRLRIDAEIGEDNIARDRDYLSTARDALEKDKSEARWRLNENAPPYLEKVVVKRGGETFYEAEWGFDEEKEEKEELLRLAQYLHEDLGRTIPLRRASTKDLGDQLLAERRLVTQMYQGYHDLMGGSKDTGFWAGVERLFDKTPGLSALGGSGLVNFGWHPWRKSGVEIADGGITVLRDFLFGGVPPYIAFLTEAAFQIGDVLYRAARGESKNPSWDINAMPHAGPANVSHPVNSQDFKAIIDSLNKGRIRSSLERMRDQVKPALKGEDFRQQLVRRYQGETLAIALSQTAVTRNMPKLRDLKQWNPGGSILDSTFNFFTQPTGAAKTTWKTALLPFASEGFDIEKGFAQDRNFGKDIFWDAVQAAVRDGIIEMYEKERLKIWYDCVKAEADVQLIYAIFQNESRLRRIDQHIQKILAEQLIPELTAEVERLRASRELDIVKDAELKDERATLVMTFSSEVDMERVTLGDVALLPKQKRGTWEAGIDPEQFEDADGAPLQLTVVARPVAFEERQLDDPKTVASWSTQTSSFNAYEQKPDTYHKIRLKPEELAGEIAYYPRCIVALLPAEKHLISAKNERHWTAYMEKASRGEDMDAEAEEMRDDMSISISQFFLGGGASRGKLFVWSTIATTLIMIGADNLEHEVVPGKRKRYFYTFPVVNFSGDENRLFCIPGQPCYLEKDGGLYSRDNEWLKLAAERHKKGIIEFRKDFAERMRREESRSIGESPLGWALLSAGPLMWEGNADADVGNSCEWWAPKLPSFNYDRIY